MKLSGGDAAGAAPWQPGSAAADVSVDATARSRDFVGALESVRGLAALAVLIFHSTMPFLPLVEPNSAPKTLSALTPAEELLRRLVYVAFNGHIAVNLFFVLSGFVLALSLRRDDRAFLRRAGGFVGRRLFRIYPALAVNLLITAAVIAGCAAAIPTVAPASFTWDDLAGNLLLTSFNVNGATWTLLMELLAIPLLLTGDVLARRFGMRGILPLTMATIVGLFSISFVRGVLPGNSLSNIRLYIVDYQFMFAIGMLAAELPVRDRLRKKPRAVKFGIIAALIAMLGAPLPLGYTSSSRWSMMVEVAGAAALVALLAYGPRTPVHHFLDWHPIRVLGRISYSFYLYHATALAALLPGITWYMTQTGVNTHPFLASLSVATAATVVTVPLAWTSYHLIELPMIRVGSRL